MYRRSVQSSDDAQLQTDVMRFMAIVAFCLIAVLAVVRNVDAPTPKAKARVPAEPAATIVSSAQPAAESEPQPEIEPDIAPPIPEASLPAKPQRVVESPPAEPTDPTTDASARVVFMELPKIERPRVRLTEPAPADTPAPAPDPAPIVASPAPPIERPAEPQSEATPEPEPGLTLRFASDSDFLRLVARGTVKVYAFSEETILTLDDGFAFAPTKPPGEVHELDVGTIPARLRQALGRSDTDMKWAVALSSRMQDQISDLVQIHQHGALTIDRFQKVRHVP